MAAVRIAGVDFNTNAIDMVLLELDGEEPPRWLHYDLPAWETAFRRTREVPEVLPARRSMFWDGMLALALEEPFGYGGSAAPLMRVQGAILSCISPAVRVVELSPGSWRKAVGLPGNASKEAVRNRALRTPGIPFTWPQDAYDAYCMARALERLLEEEAG